MPISLPLPELTPAQFLQRDNRFLLRVLPEGSGRPVSVHMADPGRLKELLVPGRRMWIRPAAGKDRKTQWSAVLVESPAGDEWVSLDTGLPNRLIRKALEGKALSEFGGWGLERAEVSLGRSRLDFLLTRPSGGRMALEVKSVTLVEGGVALFPDAVTSRGARHVRELAELAVRPGWEAAVLFVLQRSDAREIRAAREIDPAFAQALEEAKAAGVRILGRRCRVGVDSVELGPPVPADVG